MHPSKLQPEAERFALMLSGPGDFSCIKQNQTSVIARAALKLRLHRRQRRHVDPHADDADPRDARQKARTLSFCPSEAEKHAV